MTDLLRRGIDTFIEMQQHFLTIASKQTDLWIDAAKEGKPFDGKHVAGAGPRRHGNFVRSQKKFLDVVAEETAHATGARTGTRSPRRRPNCRTWPAKAPRPSSTLRRSCSILQRSKWR